MTRNELYRQICETEERFEKAKTKRLVVTFLAFTAAFFVLDLYINRPKGLDILDILGTLVVCAIFSVVHILINAAIFGQLYRVGESERKYLEHLEKKLSEMD